MQRGPFHDQAQGARRELAGKDSEDGNRDENLRM